MTVVVSTYSAYYSLLTIGSDDKQVRVVAAMEKYQNLSIHSLAAHKAAIIGNHFEEKSYSVRVMI